MSVVSVGVNCGIIYWTSNDLPYIFQDKYSDLEVFMLIVLIEHVIIIFKMVLSVVIKDKP